MSLMSYAANNAAGAAMSETVDPGVSYQLEVLRLHLSAAGGAGATLNVDLDSVLGSAHDCRLYTLDISALADVCKVWERPIPLQPGDKILTSFTNPNGKNWGLVLVWSTI